MTSNTYKSLTAGVLAAALLVAPANAQFGGMLAKAKSAAGLGSTDTNATTMTGDEADVFLAASLRSTKNVLIATALIAQAVENRGPLTALKTEINSYNNISEIKEVGAYKRILNANLAALNGRKDLAADFQASYQTRSVEEKKLLGIAVANLAIGVARNVELVGKASHVVAAIKSNPKLLMRAAQFKTAAELVGLQGKGLAGVAGSVPKLIAAAKVRGPKDAKTSDPQPVTF